MVEFYDGIFVAHEYQLSIILEWRAVRKAERRLITFYPFANKSVKKTFYCLAANEGKDMLGILEPCRGGDEIPLRKNEVVVGRSEKNDVVLRFSDISGKHCRLILSKGYWYVEDLGSTNGTKVNGFKTRDKRVDPDSRISFAKHEYYLRYDPIKNGSEGDVPPETLDSNVFEKSLLERAGVSKQVRSMPKTWEIQRQKGSTLEELELGGGKDYSNLTLDDIEFDN